MYLHKFTSIFEEKVPGKVGNAYLTDKSVTASGALSRPQTPAYRVMYLQAKINE